MGLVTLAEFVENKKTAVILETLGIDYAQGFHIGKPKPLDVGSFKAYKNKYGGDDQFKRVA